MAWNEPGGSGDKDPWGGKRDQGPPDLDEVVRKLQERLNSIFGGKGGGNGSTSNPSGGVGFGSLGMIGILLLVVWSISGIYIIDEGQQGVVLQFGAYKDTTEAGPHWYPRFIQTVEKVDIASVRSVDIGYRADESLMLTQDENIIDVKFTVQYKVQSARDYLFNVRTPDETLREATESAVRDVIGNSNMDYVITDGRGEVVVNGQKLLQEILDSYKTGLIVTQLTMQEAQAPQQVQGAFADAIKAREDKERLENEAYAYANDIVPKARGQAARITEEAKAYKEQIIAKADGESSRFLSVLAQYKKAPEVTRKRLYIDTMESVLSRSSKVLIDSEGGNNLLYLPLDRMIQQGSGSGVTTAQPAPNLSSTINSAESQLRDNLRRREVR